MHEIEHLISAVQQRPCLWDVKHQDYHNRDVKEEAWQEVCRQITSNWDQLDKTTKYETSLTFKKKWTNVRDSYRKELQALGKLASGPRKRKYKYARHLKFLKSCIRVRRSPLVGNNETSEEEESEADDDNEPKRKIHVVSIPQEFKEDRASPPTGYTEMSLSPCSVPASREYVNTLNIGDTLNAPSQMPKVFTPAEDDDTKFLLSFRGDLKTMSQSQKIEFKIGMLRLIQKILHHDTGSDPAHATNSNSFVM